MLVPSNHSLEREIFGMKKIMMLFSRYKQIILYLIFGALTTALNVFAYWVLAHPLGLDTLVSTLIAWVIGVLFAFFTNKFFVFESKGRSHMWAELGSFTLARAVTGALDVGIMFVFVTVLSLNDMLIKIISNVVVIILNYIFSKFLIFAKKSHRHTSSESDIAEGGDKQ